jgi:hypothetical protein
VGEDDETPPLLPTMGSMPKSAELRGRPLLLSYGLL